MKYLKVLYIQVLIGIALGVLTVELVRLETPRGGSGASARRAGPTASGGAATGPCSRACCAGPRASASGRRPRG